jgi:uncharacterized protein YjbI with pentapeptide repeats
VSEQDGTQSSTKRRRSLQTSKHNDGTQVPALQRPANDDKEAWKAYWKAQGQTWRTEPEIDIERQKYLAERRCITPDIEQGIYPFKGIKLSRADVEWLVVTHENGRGPIDWNDKSQREREELDLRGADLRSTDLQNLPLARLRGALKWREGPNPASEYSERRKAAEILLEGANLKQAHLEGAILTGVHLEKAELERSYLGEAYLIRVHLEGAFLDEAHLERANLTGAYMEGAFLRKVHLGDENHIGPRLVDIQWGNTNLAIVDWAQVNLLDDEYRARQKKEDGQIKEKAIQINEYEKAVRANRQLSIALQNQGLNEDAARFAYRAQKLQQVVFRLQRKFGQYLFSLFLDLLAGYGYKPWRSFVAYLLVITVFATAYLVIGRTVGPILSPVGAWVFSMTSFHGRGFFPGGIKLDDPLTILAALEAFVGLLIEVTFIATLTQRLFGK